MSEVGALRVRRCRTPPETQFVKSVTSNESSAFDPLSEFSDDFSKVRLHPFIACLY